MPCTGGWPDFGGIVDPRDAHIRIWLDTLMAAKTHDDPLPAPAQPQYRTECPACYVAMSSSQWNVDAGLSEGRLNLCQHHRRALPSLLDGRTGLTTAFLVNLNDWVIWRERPQ
jgi:hypothetical protein